MVSKFCNMFSPGGGHLVDVKEYTTNNSTLAISKLEMRLDKLGRNRRSTPGIELDPAYNSEIVFIIQKRSCSATENVGGVWSLRQCHKTIYVCISYLDAIYFPEGDEVGMGLTEKLLSYIEIPSTHFTTDYYLGGLEIGNGAMT